MSAVGFGVFSYGQLSSAKQKAINTADAMALAGGAAEARLLNLMAYNNRQILAGEVMVAQVLSLESWLGYAYHTSYNIGTILEWVPYAQAIAAILLEAAEYIDYVREDIMNPTVVPMAIKIQEIKKSVVSAGHYAITLGGGAVAGLTANAILDASNKGVAGRPDEQMEVTAKWVTMEEDLRLFSSFTKKYDGDKDDDYPREHAKQAMLASMDEWVTARNGNALTNLEVPYTIRMNKKGSATLRDYDKWEFQDTQGLDIWDWGKMEWQEAAPIGWGRNNVNDDNSAGEVWGGAESDKMAYEDGEDHIYDGWSGVPKLYDIKDRGKRDDLGLPFYVAIKRSQSNIDTATTMGVGSADNSHLGNTLAKDHLGKDQVAAIAAVKVRFVRPTRSGEDKTGSSLFRDDGRKEWGSLYSPYWQARLTDIDTARKAAIYLEMGLPVGGAIATP